MIKIDHPCDLTPLQNETRPSPAPAEDGLVLTLSYLRAAPDGEHIYVGVELASTAMNVCEKKRYPLLLEWVEEQKLRRGPITREQLEQIEHAAVVSAAYGRALSILAYSANSAKSLMLKLRQRGFDAGVAAEVVARLDTRGYLREIESARREAERSLGKGWGIRRIEGYLRARGYDAETTRAAIETLDTADTEERCLRILCRRSPAPPADRKERQKLIAYLVRQGYEMSVIHRVLNRAWEETED